MSNHEAERNTVTYPLLNFKGLINDDNVEKKTEHPAIESCIISDNLSELKFYLKPGIYYEDAKEEIELLANQIFMHLLIHPDVNLTHQQKGEASYTPKPELDNTQKISCASTIEGIAFGLPTMVRTIKKICPDSLDDLPPIKQHRLLYSRIFGILDNSNLVIQYLSFYQIMCIQINEAEGKHGSESQRTVYKYFDRNKEVYKADPFKISFTPSRKDQKKMEDSLTYLRNEIVHCEQTDDVEKYSKTPVTPVHIKFLLRVINNLLKEKSQTT